ncbi:Putative metal-sulfur cluster biosynthesis proteins YuaD [Vibrio aerogenes CECT 7868]|uniref:Putative metal-sulfur cluster biosynthesis proteins YuaD n=1 Tax=Vibrio aerogenes CECT 7868 TaxID=1216006 RepID=A0A1M5YFG3_9VIBR|nr:MOSC domain-containing protein [Vibrio aerogenes]SHI10785.1 Putative metal-sulfur cluster biosynthesis proteins YuaD [Vibrio aerogenes CECT 7868]
MAKVVSVSKSEKHTFSKSTVNSIMLIEGEGVEGDAHRGKTVKHRSRVKADPTQPNLRQVHLIHQELFDELKDKGFEVGPSELGENITTRGIDLLSLPKGTLLRFPQGAEILITGLRNPCPQIEAFQKGLLSQVLDRDSSGNVVRKAGVMGIITAGGLVNPDDHIEIILPDEPFEKLERV